MEIKDIKFPCLFPIILIIESFENIIFIKKEINNIVIIKKTNFSIGRKNLLSLKIMLYITSTNDINNVYNYIEHSKIIKYFC